ncbi:replication initiation negative regulator SeqA [Salinimonas sp. HHU 13199]|uniref:Negative modulator of initiation of replication n=1 Tax=Salinimonas profundi TaxID=2729140 RepID=A0ABR8LFC1_9ALTE|nr:replication initiation negative regulator SeqA [Salinimonas profundi]MBD3584956.1 replication initiation negative regulator SeqA [Salinimonas profundi]
MKSIDIDDDLYAFIAGQTKHIGESASDILRRLLMDGAAQKVSADGKSVLQAKTTQTAATRPQEKKPSAPSANKTANPAANTPSAGHGPVAKPVAPAGNDITSRLSKEVLEPYTKRVDLFLFILAQLHELQPQNFAQVEQIKGKNRIYFATSKDALLKTGSSTNPKQIPDSPYWVVTNNNTAKKIAMLEQVLQVLGYDAATRELVVNRFA